MSFFLVNSLEVSIKGYLNLRRLVFLVTIRKEEITHSVMLIGVIKSQLGVFKVLGKLYNVRFIDK